MDITIKEVGTPGTGILVPINTPNLKSNRIPKQTNLNKYLKKSDNQFVWALFGAPVIAEYPDGEREVIDGRHRVDLLTMSLPNITQYPATIVQVKDKQEASRLFHRYNGTSSSKVSNECRFIHEVLGDETSLLKDEIIRLLAETGITIWEHDECYVPQQVTPEWRINLKGIEFMITQNNGSRFEMADGTIRPEAQYGTARDALNLYMKAWGPYAKSKKDTPKVVTVQIAKALQHIYMTYGDWLRNEAHRDAFENWFIKRIEFAPNIAEHLYNAEYQHDRMEWRHLGTALGLFTAFCSHMRNRTLSGGLTVPSIKPIQRSFDEYTNRIRNRADDV